MIVRFLKWALSKFEPKPTPTLKEKLDAWPFPVGRLTKDFSIEPCEKPEAKKPTLKKATTRTKKPAVKKPIKKGK